MEMSLTCAAGWNAAHTPWKAELVYHGLGAPLSAALFPYSNSHRGVEAGLTTVATLASVVAHFLAIVNRSPSNRHSTPVLKITKALPLLQIKRKMHTFKSLSHFILRRGDLFLLGLHLFFLQERTKHKGPMMTGGPKALAFTAIQNHTSVHWMKGTSVEYTLVSFTIYCTAW